MTSTRSLVLGVVCLVAASAAVCPLAAADQPFLMPAQNSMAPANGATTPAGTPCDGLTNTTGNPNSGPHVGVLGVFLQKFTPTAYPFTPTAVCIAGFSHNAVPAAYDVVIYSDVDGQPGPRLAMVSAVPAAPGVFPGSWMTTSIAGLVPPLNGPFWAGPRMMVTTEFAMDFEPVASPVEQMWAYSDGGPFTTWNPGSTVATAEIRVVGRDGSASVPLLSGLGLAALAAALATGGFLAIKRA